MYVEAVPNRSSPPAILLRESYREAGKVKKRTLLNLTDWPTQLVEGLRTLLKGGTALPPGQQALTIRRALPHGHVAAVLGMLRRLGLDRLLGPAGHRCRDLVVAMIVARLLAPTSKLATARALAPNTAAHSLGAVLGLGAVDEDELYTALDCGCGAQRPCHHRARLAACASAGGRGCLGQAPSPGRHAGALRRLLQLPRGTLLRAGPARPQP